jgi:hypothetical protein
MAVTDQPGQSHGSEIDQWDSPPAVVDRGCSQAAPAVSSAEAKATVKVRDHTTT